MASIYKKDAQNGFVKELNVSDQWSRENLLKKEREILRVISQTHGDFLKLYREETLSSALRVAQAELKGRAHAQGEEGKRYPNSFLKENKGLVDHVLVLHRAYRDAEKKIDDQNSAGKESSIEEITLHHDNKQNPRFPLQRWDQITLDMKLRRISTFVEHGDEGDMEEFRDRTIAPALKGVLKEIKARAHAQGEEGKRYNPAFMKEQKSLIDHALAVHRQYKIANKMVQDWKEEYADLVNDNSEFADLGRFFPPPWEGKDYSKPQKTLGSIFRSTAAKAASLAVVAITATFGWVSINGSQQTEGKTYAAPQKPESSLVRKDGSTEKSLRSFFYRAGFFKEEASPLEKQKDGIFPAGQHPR